MIMNFKAKRKRNKLILSLLSGPELILKEIIKVVYGKVHLKLIYEDSHLNIKIFIQLKLLFFQ